MTTTHPPPGPTTPTPPPGPKFGQPDGGDDGMNPMPKPKPQGGTPALAPAG